MSYAVRLSRGTYITAWHAGDFYGPGRLQRQLQALRDEDAQMSALLYSVRCGNEMCILRALLSFTF
jgi:hypothetical protein